MTSAHALNIADSIIENDPSKAGPLIKLLYAFRASRGDPLGEAMMRDVLGHLFIQTSECDSAIENFVAEGDSTPIAA